jgi:hypothetical protein
MKIVKTTFVQKVKIQECENGMVRVTVPPNQLFYLTVNEENGSGAIYSFFKRNFEIAKKRRMVNKIFGNKPSFFIKWKDMF